MSNLTVVGNHVYLEYVKDLEQNHKILVAKLTNTSKFRRLCVGKIINCPKYIKGEKGKILYELNLPKGTYVIYAPIGTKYKDKDGYIVRGEDVLAVFEDYDKFMKS